MKYLLQAIGFGLLGLIALLFTRFNLFRLGWQRHNSPWHDLGFLHLDWLFQTQEPYWSAHIQNLAWLGIGLLILVVATVLFIRNLRRLLACMTALSLLLAPALPQPAYAAEPGPTPASPVCGPDVTEELKNALARTRTAFAAWTLKQKTEGCQALVSLKQSPSGHFYGEIAWDVVELHNNHWILSYRIAGPDAGGCATAGAIPRCGSSVQVGGECYYAGSPNYALFGALFKSCHDHFHATEPRRADTYTEKEMLWWIDIYKGPLGPRGVLRPASGNFIPSRQWAVAGYRGWPLSKAPAPSGDRSNCIPICPLPYSGPTFKVRWSFENGKIEYL